MRAGPDGGLATASEFSGQALPAFTPAEARRLLWVDRAVMLAGLVGIASAAVALAAAAADEAAPAASRVAGAWSGVAYLLLGLGLAFAQERVAFPGVPRPWGPRIATGSAATLGLVGLLFFGTSAAGATPEWGMPGATALVFGSLGSALLARRRFPWISLGVSLAWLGLIFVILVWYAYAVASILGPSVGASFATPTLLVFLALVAGMLLLHIDRGKLAVVVEDTPGGQAVRRALLPALVVPPLVGYVFLQGEAAGIYDSTVKTALVASTMTLVYTLIISATARSLRRLDAKRHAAEKEVLESRRTLAAAQRIGHVGSWDWDIVADRATWSEELFRIFGLEPAESGGDLAKALEIMHPEDRGRVEAAVKRALEVDGQYDIEYRVVRPDGEVRFVTAKGEVTHDGSGNPLQMVGAVHDMTERKRAELELSERAAELARSNAELEQFAYVASHDLQEPLRMVASYVQLIERRYKGQLDADADEFIGFAVEGANRMQALIQDLLLFSRVGSRGQDFVPMDVGDALAVARQNLEVAIEESGAQVTSDDLPRARADPTQLGQLFQNLLANAIKFRGEGPPRIHVTGKANGTWCEITVKDHGIGIDPKHFDRIFLIFQRLHSRAEYPGTGIGLAVCRRIVERHGGRIWVESAPGEGTAFHFTIPSVSGGAGG